MQVVILLLCLIPSISFSQIDDSTKMEIELLKIEVRELLKEIDTLKSAMDSSKMYRLRQENDELRLLMRKFIFEIDSLNTRNLMVTDERDEYKKKTESFEEKAAPRKLLQGLESSVIEAKETCTLVFELTLNESGYVKKVTFLPSKSTTDDEDLIRSVSELIRNQVRYNYSKGVKEQIVQFTVKLNAV